MGSNKSDPTLGVTFPPTDHALNVRLKHINPVSYARTRNFLTGSVTRISPYINHGFTTTFDVNKFLQRKFNICKNHKLVKELAWHDFYLHYLTHQPTCLSTSVKATIIPEKYYIKSIPNDLISASTGITAIDQAVKLLYEEGYIHNHMRLWLASYLVHIRKVKWQSGANWMYSYLLDGNLASNHLSWQWVAGTLTGKPYLFNADNVQKYARHLGGSGTSIDNSYNDLSRIARTNIRIQEKIRPPNQRIRVPPVVREPKQVEGVHKVERSTTMTIIHPWSLKRCKHKSEIGLIIKEFHQQWPWSEKRWDFVMERMLQITQKIHVKSLAEAQQMLSCGSYSIVETQNLFYKEICKLPNVRIIPNRPIYKVANREYSSFSQYWKAICREN